MAVLSYQTSPLEDMSLHRPAQISQPGLAVQRQPAVQHIDIKPVTVGIADPKRRFWTAVAVNAVGNALRCIVKLRQRFSRRDCRRNLLRRGKVPDQPVRIFPQQRDVQIHHRDGQAHRPFAQPRQVQRRRNILAKPGASQRNGPIRRKNRRADRQRIRRLHRSIPSRAAIPLSKGCLTFLISEI